MIEIEASVMWARGEGDRFVDRRYSRAHRWKFDGGAEVVASASPHIVPVPYSDPAGVDPEEAYVAAISSCHMLVYLDIAARTGFVVDTYADTAKGTMEKGEHGVLHVSRVILRPDVRYVGEAPSAEVEAHMHHKAHQGCFIARSVRTQIVVEQPNQA